jgi:hypothetical protein
MKQYADSPEAERSDSASPPPAGRPRSKALVVWLALLLGAFGAHRLYLRGPRDPWAWLHWPASLLGAAGVVRMSNLGQDDRVAWLLIPLLGASLAAALLNGIVWGLTPDERWNARENAGRTPDASGWAVVIGVVLCLMVGATVTMATLAFAIQKVFEYQIAVGAVA